MIECSSEADISGTYGQIAGKHDSGIFVGEINVSNGKFLARVYDPQAVYDFAKDLVTLAIREGANEV